MFKTYIGIDEFVDDGQTLCFFLGVKPPASIPRTRKLFFPAISEAAVIAVRELSPKLLKRGVSVIINPETYDQEKTFVDNIQRHLAYLYAKFIVFPSASNTIPDSYNVRGGESSFSVIREWVKAKNLPLHLRYPLCDVLAKLKLNYPVLVLLAGPSLSGIGPHLKELRDKCIVVCIARSLPFCLENSCPPDFVVHLDTDIKMKHLFPEGRFDETFLVTLSSANISEVAPQFAGTFFKDSFAPGLTGNTYRLRESWLSCSISCLGMAEALGASKLFVAGGDHSWGSNKTEVIHYIDEKREKHDDFSGPFRIANRYPGENVHVDVEGVFDSFEFADVNGKKCFTSFHYLATAEELRIIALEFKEKGIDCFKIQSSGILSEDAFPFVDIETLLKGKDIDRYKLLADLKRVDFQNCKLDYAVIENLHYDLLRQVEQNVSFLRIKYNEHDLRKMSESKSLEYDGLDESICISHDAVEHPYVRSVIQASAARKFQAPLRPWIAVAYAIQIGSKWAKSLEKSLAHIKFRQIVATGTKVRFFYVDKLNIDDLEIVYKYISKENVDVRKIVLSGIEEHTFSTCEVPYLSFGVSPYYFFCIFSDEVETKYGYLLDISLRFNYLLTSEIENLV